MKKFIYFLSSLLIIFGALFLLSYQDNDITFSSYASSTGSPGGKTNSPGDGFSCTQCHAGTLNPGNASAVISAPGLTNGYTPGQTYTITASISGTTSNKIGFESTIESDANNSKTGTIIITDGTRTKTTNGGNAITHKSAGTSSTGGANSWSFDWTAPSAGTGNVTIYSAFNVSNSSSTTGGDQIYTQTLNVTENVSTDIREENLEKILSIYPNPVKNILSINSVKNINLVEIINISGQSIKVIKSNSNQMRIDFSEFNSGIYFARVYFKDTVITKKFTKK